MNECLELQDKTLVRISLYLASQSLIPLPASISIPRISGGPNRKTNSGIWAAGSNLPIPSTGRVFSKPFS